MYTNTKLYIDGDWKLSKTDQAISVLNPANESIIGEVSKASLIDLQASVESAENGFKVWKSTPALERAKILNKAADLLRERVEDIARTMTLEQGKPLKQSKIEVLSAADIINWFAAEAVRSYGQVIPSRSNDVLSYTLKVPVGIVAAFTPWNFPINQIVRKISAALAAGCSIIVKGPEETPASPAQLVQSFHDAGLPSGVISLVFGDPQEISTYLIEHPKVKKISFTGSTPIGKQLASLAGKHMKKVTMELGGHAPVLIFKDADIDKALHQIINFKFRNAGQVCISPTRFLIEKEVYEQVVEKIAQLVKALKVGNGLDESTDIGPVIHSRAYGNLKSIVADALHHGAKLVCGGEQIQGEGYFFQPTVLKDVPLTAQCMNSEPFGPIVICNSFDDYSDAIEEANRLPFGLAAYAFSQNNKTCIELGRDLECGMLSINHIGLSFPELPFGGIKDSGYGTEGGSEAINAYLDTRLVTVSA
ncbi:NAD-dependent succinate-semialdehyde dehydrogenase [Acinetobacter wuhouensis]|uniref:NAD-dependent succinate-semialdehyde dehydrogenase n=1 Tax=Acinetobacter wuhouensis TaxID=1879050 RepID=A0A3G2T445_9GAMM|nr:NAD-dependent succinate-semialdehyde dehydrogenase [Acinetobacter wuhouensis]AYO54732.1 NAD-dependent succinate-semialdehyde dehydrogenase [Acinetobacter wuhouensis]